jgi:hypothetical protein
MEKRSGAKSEGVPLGQRSRPGAREAEEPPNGGRGEASWAQSGTEQRGYMSVDSGTEVPTAMVPATRAGTE